MAESKGIALNKRILAKLMLLEYFKPETFKLFYESQSKNNGIIAGIERLEDNIVDEKNPAKAQKKAASDEPVTPALTIEQEALLQDTWLASWFKSEPSLKNENLQPYYYFSRDRLSVSGTHLQRMSPAAQEVFRKITADGESVINLGIEESKALSIGDASAVFEALTEKINQQDKQTGENPILKRLFYFCAIRTELISQILIFVEKLPELILPFSVTTWLIETTKSTAYSVNATKLLTKWSENSTNTNLAKVSATKLKQN